MRKVLFFILLLIVFVSAIIIDRNVRQESRTARYGSTAPEVRDDDILEVTIGHPEGLPVEDESRSDPAADASTERPPVENRPERTEPRVQPKPEEPARPAQRTEPPSQDPRGERHIYVVQEGDTLSGIARKLLGDETKFRLLIEWNELRNPDQIFPGDRLRYYK